MELQRTEHKVTVKLQMSILCRYNKFPQDFGNRSSGKENFLKNKRKR